MSTSFTATFFHSPQTDWEKALVGDTYPHCPKRSLGCLGRLIAWIRNPNHSTCKKTILVALTILISLALAISIIGLPIACAAFKEQHMQGIEDAYLRYKRDVNGPIQKERERILSRLGLGEKELEKIPDLDIGNKVSQTGGIDFIAPSHMTSSIMKGFDFYRRPFLAFKVTKSKKVGVLTYFQEKLHEPQWKLASPFVLKKGAAEEIVFNILYKNQFGLVSLCAEPGEPKNTSPV